MAIQFNEGETIWYSNKLKIANSVGNAILGTNSFKVDEDINLMSDYGMESSEEDFVTLLCDIILGISCNISEKDLRQVCDTISNLHLHSWNMNWTSPEAYLEDVYPGGDWTDEEYEEAYRAYDNFYSLVNPSSKKRYDELTPEDFADAPLLIKNESEKGCLFLRDGNLIVSMGYLPSYNPIA